MSGDQVPDTSEEWPLTASVEENPALADEPAEAFAATAEAGNGFADAPEVLPMAFLETPAEAAEAAADLAAEPLPQETRRTARFSGPLPASRSGRARSCATAASPWPR